jgi:hypothetical protein
MQGVQLPGIGLAISASSKPGFYLQLGETVVGDVSCCYSRAAGNWSGACHPALLRIATLNLCPT